MTEEIIIDGVDVSECNAYKDKHCKDKTAVIFCETNLCSNYPNCYYKQLKRLEQKYNEVLKLAKENADSNEYCLQELEKENKKLKKRLEIADKQMSGEEERHFKMQEEIEELKAKLSFETQKREEFSNKYIKYQFALEEINEIVLENPWEETDNWIKEKILKVLESEEQ